MRMQVEVPDQLWEQFRRTAASQGQTASRALRELMAGYITKPVTAAIREGTDVPDVSDAPEEHAWDHLKEPDLGIELPPGVQRGVAGIKGRGR